MPLVMVTWLDASGCAMSMADADLIETRTVGWLVRQSKRAVWIAQDQRQDGSVCGITTIPRGMVERLQVLSQSVDSHERP